MSLDDRDLNNSMSEIRIQFDYSTNTGATAPIKNQTEDVYNSIDLKQNSKFDQDAIKQRTREGLKFWQREEEKRKKVDGLALPKFNTYLPLQASSSNSSTSNKELKTATVSMIPTSYFPEGSKRVIDEEAVRSTTSRVKDRINVFETKMNEESVPSGTSFGLKKSSFLAKPVVSTKKFPMIGMKETIETITTTTTHQREKVDSQVRFENKQLMKLMLLVDLSLSNFDS